MINTQDLFYVNCIYYYRKSYILCKSWVIEVPGKVIGRLTTDNSLLILPFHLGFILLFYAFMKGIIIVKMKVY